ncbi:hypothetical protein CBE12_02210 [Euryarchaeota archaeon TMED252]|nr:MAG: hypothetical protein CBE12_02210 [Euryarchaeota archaeon TMED252]
MDVNLVDATWSDAFRPDHVLDGSPRVGFHVRVDVEHASALGILRPAVNALAGWAHHVQIEVVEIVPHQRNLNVAGRGAFTLEAGPKFRSRTLRSSPGLHFCLSASGFHFGLPLNLDFCEFGLTGVFALFSEASLFCFPSRSKASLFFRFPLQAFFLSTACFGFFHSPACVLFLSTRLFFTVQTGRVASPLARVVRLKASSLALYLGELAVKFSARCCEIRPSDPGTQPFSNETLAKINAGISPKHQSQDAKAESRTEDTGQGQA